MSRFPTATLGNFQAIYFHADGKTWVAGDTDGVAGADFFLEIQGKKNLSTSDLIVDANATQAGWQEAIFLAPQDEQYGVGDLF